MLPRRCTSEVMTFNFCDLACFCFLPFPHPSVMNQGLLHLANQFCRLCFASPNSIHVRGA